MVPKRFSRISADAPTAVSDLQEAVAAFSDGVSLCPLLSGVSVSGTAAGAGNVVVKHGLGRTPSGWLLTDLTGGAHTAVRRSAWDSRSITMTVSAACAFSLWVF